MLDHRYNEPSPFSKSFCRKKWRDEYTSAASPAPPFLRSRSPVKRAGFTLIEILVVISIISILLGIGITIYGAIIEKSRFNGTVDLINALHLACTNYKTSLQEYPPMTYESSKSLHYYLGQVLEVPMGYGDDSLPLPKKKVGPFFEFKMSQLEGNPKTVQPNPPRFILDLWRHRIVYKNPGVKHIETIDIVSKGAEAADQADDIMNPN